MSLGETGEFQSRSKLIDEVSDFKGPGWVPAYATNNIMAFFDRKHGMCQVELPENLKLILVLEVPKVPIWAAGRTCVPEYPLNLLALNSLQVGGYSVVLWSRNRYLKDHWLSRPILS